MAGLRWNPKTKKWEQGGLGLTLDDNNNYGISDPRSQDFRGLFYNDVANMTSDDENLPWKIQYKPVYDVKNNKYTYEKRSKEEIEAAIKEAKAQLNPIRMAAITDERLKQQEVLNDLRRQFLAPRKTQGVSNQAVQRDAQQNEITVNPQYFDPMRNMFSTLNQNIERPNAAQKTIEYDPMRSIYTGDKSNIYGVDMHPDSSGLAKSIRDFMSVKTPPSLVVDEMSDSLLQDEYNGKIKSKIPGDTITKNGIIYMKTKNGTWARVDDTGIIEAYKLDRETIYKPYEVIQVNDNGAYKQYIKLENGDWQRFESVLGPMYSHADYQQGLSESQRFVERFRRSLANTLFFEDNPVMPTSSQTLDTVADLTGGAAAFMMPLPAGFGTSNMAGAFEPIGNAAYSSTVKALPNTVNPRVINILGNTARGAAAAGAYGTVEGTVRGYEPQDIMTNTLTYAITGGTIAGAGTAVKEGVSSLVQNYLKKPVQARKIYIDTRNGFKSKTTDYRNPYYQPSSEYEYLGNGIWQRKGMANGEYEFILKQVGMDYLRVNHTGMSAEESSLVAKSATTGGADSGAAASKVLALTKQNNNSVKALPESKRLLQFPGKTNDTGNIVAVDVLPKNASMNNPIFEINTAGEKPQIIENSTYKKPAVGESNSRIKPLPVDSIHVDPARFQFKMDVNRETGAGRGLDIQKWDDNLAGIVTVWQDSDGKNWIVNGHHRLEKAKELGVKTLDARILKESDGISAQKAREIGAKINIAEGHGSLTDAAKVFRDGKYTLEDIKNSGLALSSGSAKKGFAIAQLNDRLFDKVVTKKLTEEKAAIIGEGLPTDNGGINDAKQNAIYDKIEGKRVSDDELKEMVDAIKDVDAEGVEQKTLLGTETIWGNVDFDVKPKLIAEVKSILTSDKGAFNKAIKNETSLKRAGNILNTESNMKQKQLIDTALEMIDKGKNKSGDPINGILNKYVQQVRAGMSNPEAARYAEGEIVKLIKDNKYLHAGDNKSIIESEGIEGQRDLFGGVVGGESGLNKVGTGDTGRRVQLETAHAGGKTKDKGRKLEKGTGRGETKKPAEKPRLKTNNEFKKEVAADREIEGKKLTPFDTEDIIKARESLKNIEETYKINTSERQKLRKDIADKLYGEGARNKNRRADIVIGPPAAGKSSVLVKPLVREHGSLVIDSDDAKEMLPEFNGGAGAGAVHQESSYIVDRLVYPKAIKNGDNIVLPLVGKNVDKIRSIKDKLVNQGYEVHLHINELPPEKAAQRAITRFKETGRFVDPDYVLNKVGNSPVETYETLKNEGGFASYERWSNDVEKGQSPKLIERIQGRGMGRDGGGLSTRSHGRNGERTGEGEIKEQLINYHPEYKDDKEALKLAEEAIQLTFDIEEGKIDISSVKNAGVDTTGWVVTRGLGISAQFIKHGKINLIGQEAKTPRQVAALAQVFRDPRYEIFRIIYTKDGKVVDVEGRTSRVPE